MWRRLALPLALSLALGAIAPTEPSSGSATGSPALSISMAALRAHVQFLADDRLEGRDTGSRGHELAALYAAGRFAEYGLEPGADGGYRQPIRFASLQLEESRIVAAGPSGRAELEWKRDYLFSPQAAHPELSLEAPLVYLGYGVDAPELGHRDYEGVDVRGRVVLVLSGAPASFPATQRAHHSSRRVKAEAAAAHGAIGVVGVRTRIDAERTPWERMTLNAGRPGFDWKHPDGRVEGGPPEIRFQAVLSEAGAERLLAGSGTSLATLLDGAEKVDYIRGELGITLRVRSRSTLSEVASPNVVAVLPGSDPALRAEHIVVTAHLDHIGIGAEVEGDTIYNGFFDNALGSAILIEVARALAGAAERPRRSIVFLLVTGEEKGLLGSEYFAQYPTVPAASLVANVNIDMPLLLRPVVDLVALGAEHSSLGELAAAAARANGFELSPDPNPEEVNFVRSDQYSFVRHGVPAINYNPGARAPGGGGDQAEAIERFRKECYHRPCDELGLGADWESTRRYAATNADLIARIAAADRRPEWNRGDFFGVKFAGAR